RNIEFKTHISQRTGMKQLSIFKRLTISTLFLVVFAVTSGFSTAYNVLSGDVNTESYYRTLEKFSQNSINSDDLPDWALLDPETDGYEGTRTKKFYKYVESLNLPRSEVIVAVIDSGFDINHPDLKDAIWKNEAEINGLPGVDDDGNGYVDDFNGWNFLGNVKYSNFEMTREFRRLKNENVPDSDPYLRKVIREMADERD